MKKKEERPKQNYIVNGSTVRPVGSLRQVEPYLEANVYSIYVSPLAGPELEIVDNIDLSVPKRVYGNIMERVDKSFKAYSYRERNTGILLSGERGMGKTLFIRIAINRALEMGIPVLMLRKTSSLESIIDTVNSITQPLLVVMDEFEKNFSISSDGDGPDNGDQTQFLTMLDGLGSSEKRMFIASINSTYNINEFLLNRPGRFYYHFDFPSLGEKECTEYLSHETRGLNKKTIQYAVMAMQNYSINYDGLAAIATELNHGHPIEDTLRDLNLDRQGNSSYEVVVMINGFEYCGIIEDSLETLQQERDRYAFRLHVAAPCRQGLHRLPRPDGQLHSAQVQDRDGQERQPRVPARPGHSDRDLLPRRRRQGPEQAERRRRQLLLAVRRPQVRLNGDPQAAKAGQNSHVHLKVAERY